MTRPPEHDDPAAPWRLPDEVDGAWGARRALAAALRDLAERCVTTTADRHALAAAADAVRALAEHLPPGPGSFDRFTDGSYGARAVQNIDRTALMGRSNPMAPPMVVSVDDAGRSRCAITFTEVHQGAPGMVHGGWVASVLDQMAGHALLIAGHRGFTGKLAIRYLRPSPLHRALVCTAWVSSHHGRMVTIALAIEHGGRKIVEGEAHMVVVDPDRAQDVIRNAGT